LRRQKRQTHTRFDTPRKIYNTVALNPIIVIPARLASTRLPDKPLALIGNKPMIVHVWEQAVKADIGPVAVACGDTAIKDAVERAGGRAVLTDPALPSGSDRVWAAVRKLESIHVYGRDPQKRRVFAEKMSGLLGMDVRPVESPDAAVKGRDIIITMTNASTPVFDGKLIEPGTHINAAGANLRTNRELDEIAVTRAGMIAADDVEGAKLECGDLDWPIQRGLLAWEKVYELAPIVAGRMAGRRSEDEITLFESQGIAIEDTAAGQLIYERAIERGIGTRLPF